MVSSRKTSLLEALKQESNEAQAEVIAGYLKTTSLSFIGVKLPIINKITKKHMKGLSLEE